MSDADDQAHWNGEWGNDNSIYFPPPPVEDMPFKPDKFTRGQKTRSQSGSVRNSRRSPPLTGSPHANGCDWIKCCAESLNWTFIFLFSCFVLVFGLFAIICRGDLAICRQCEPIGRDQCGRKFCEHVKGVKPLRVTSSCSCKCTNFRRE